MRWLWVPVILLLLVPSAVATTEGSDTGPSLYFIVPEDSRVIVGEELRIWVVPFGPDGPLEMTEPPVIDVTDYGGVPVNLSITFEKVEQTLWLGTIKTQNPGVLKLAAEVAITQPLRGMIVDPEIFVDVSFAPAGIVPQGTPVTITVTPLGNESWGINSPHLNEGCGLVVGQPFTTYQGERIYAGRACPSENVFGVTDVYRDGFSWPLSFEAVTALAGVEFYPIDLAAFGWGEGEAVCLVAYGADLPYDHVVSVALLDSADWATLPHLGDDCYGTVPDDWDRRSVTFTDPRSGLNINLEGDLVVPPLSGELIQATWANWPLNGSFTGNTAAIPWIVAEYFDGDLRVTGSGVSPLTGDPVTPISTKQGEHPRVLMISTGFPFYWAYYEDPHGPTVISRILEDPEEEIFYVETAPVIFGGSTAFNLSLIDDVHLIPAGLFVLPAGELAHLDGYTEWPIPEPFPVQITRNGTGYGGTFTLPSMFSAEDSLDVVMVFESYSRSMPKDESRMYAVALSLFPDESATNVQVVETDARAIVILILVPFMGLVVAMAIGAFARRP